MRKLQKCLNYKDYTVESGINVTLRSLFLDFFQGLLSYYGLKRLRFYYISLHILRGYVYCFCQIFQSTKQMEEKLNFQVPAEGLELVNLLHTQY